MRTSSASRCLQFIRADSSQADFDWGCSARCADRLRDPGRDMCKGESGAIRLEQQLTAQNVIVPQGGDVLVNNGQLDGLQNTQGHCSCEVALAKASAKAPEFSRLATPEEIEKKQALEKKEVSKREDIFLEQPAKPKEEPVYQVFMPPLAYNAKAAVQKDNFDPKLILVVRRVRVRPTLIFQGRVEDTPPKPQNAAAQNMKPGAGARAAAAPAQPRRFRGKPGSCFLSPSFLLILPVGRNGSAYSLIFC